MYVNNIDAVSKVCKLCNVSTNTLKKKCKCVYIYVHKCIQFSMQKTEMFTLYDRNENNCI